MLWSHPYLEVKDNFAQCLAQKPGICHIPDDRGREANENDKEISHCQIDNEVVCYCPHGSVSENSHAHQGIPH